MSLFQVINNTFAMTEFIWVLLQFTIQMALWGWYRGETYTADGELSSTVEEKEQMKLEEHLASNAAKLAVDRMAVKDTKTAGDMELGSLYGENIDRMESNSINSMEEIPLGDTRAFYDTKVYP